MTKGAKLTTSSGELFVGCAGRGVGTITMSDDSSMTIADHTTIGRDSGTGTIIMSGTSSITNAHEFRIGRWGAEAVGLVQMSGSSHINSGTQETWIGTDSANGTLEMSDDCTFMANYDVNIGRNAGTGTLKMSGNSFFNASGSEFRLGVSGGNGTLEMSGTSMIEARSFLRIGRNEGWDAGRGVADVTMTGSSKMISDADVIAFGSNGGKAKVVLNGNNSNDYVTIGNLNDPVTGNRIRGNSSNVYIGTDAGSECNMEMKGYSRIDVAGKDVNVGINGATTVMTMNDNANIRCGVFKMGRSGTSTVTISDAAAVSANIVYVGCFAGTAQLNAMSGALSTNSDFSVGYNWGNNTEEQGSHVANASGSTISVGGSLILGANSGKGTFNQIAGHTTVVGSVILGEGDYSDSLEGQIGAHGDAVLNLNGGTLTAPGMTTRSKVVSTHVDDKGATRIHATTAVVNFNGGTLQASATNADFIATDDAAASVTLNVLAGGAIIDTQNYAVTVTKQLLGSTGDGGLKKLGTGTLTLSADPTYTGKTIVDAGTLTVGNLTHSANVYVASTGTLNATSIVTGTLTIGGPALAATSSAAAPITAVPEPSTIVMLVLASLGTLLAWRRK
jgi:autotransporter-associated beta strand protein